MKFGCPKTNLWAFVKKVFLDFLWNISSTDTQSRGGKSPVMKNTTASYKQTHVGWESWALSQPQDLPEQSSGELCHCWVVWKDMCSLWFFSFLRHPKYKCLAHFYFTLGKTTWDCFWNNRANLSEKQRGRNRAGWLQAGLAPLPAHQTLHHLWGGKLL